MCSVKYLVMHKVQMHASAISKLLYGFASLGALFHSLKFVDYLPVQTHKPYNNLHLPSKNMQISTFNLLFQWILKKISTNYLMWLRQGKAPLQRLAILLKYNVYILIGNKKYMLEFILVAHWLGGRIECLIKDRGAAGLSLWVQSKW